MSESFLESHALNWSFEVHFFKIWILEVSIFGQVIPGGGGNPFRKKKSFDFLKHSFWGSDSRLVTRDHFATIIEFVLNAILKYHLIYIHIFAVNNDVNHEFLVQAHYLKKASVSQCFRTELCAGVGLINNDTNRSLTLSQHYLYEDNSGEVQSKNAVCAFVKHCRYSH